MTRLTRYRIFTNDVGANAYSCYGRLEAQGIDAALETSKARAFPGEKVFVVRDDEESLLRYGPDGQSGKLPAAEILQRGRKVGSVAGPWRRE